jgi:hypothetical protein
VDADDLVSSVFVLDLDIQVDIRSPANEVAGLA